MRSIELAKRNLKEMLRDPLSLGIAIGLPLGLLLTLQALGGDETLVPVADDDSLRGSSCSDS